MTLLIILVVLFATLAIAVTVMEKSKVRMSDEDTAKWARWIWPLIGVLLIVQLFMLAF